MKKLITLLFAFTIFFSANAQILDESFETWSSENILQQWGNLDYIPNTGDHIIIPLTGYSGIVKIGFYGESTVSNEDNDLFVDNVSVIEISSATHDILEANGINIYPNPSNGVFNVGLTETFNLEVIDITGKVIKTQVLDNNTNNVNISEQGIYILKLTNEKTSFMHRIIVN